MEECCLLACSVWLVQLSYTIRDLLSRGGTTHCGLDPLVSIFNQASPLASLTEHFLSGLSSLQITLTCVKLT